MEISPQLAEKEKKDQSIAAAVSVGLHALLLLLLYFLLAWKPQIPPPPEYGIELNFGLDATGSGAVQTRATANESENTEDSQPAPEVPEPSNEPTQPKVDAAPPVSEPTVVTTPEPSPFTVKEEPKVKPEPKREEVKEPEKPKALYPGKSKTNTSGSGESGTSTNPTGNSNGDDANAVGDKGDPKGTIDAKNLYGKPGQGSGGSLDMPGWRWDNIPRPNDQSNESGKLVFEVKIDDDGEIISVRKVEGTVSAGIERLYRAEVEKTTFSRTGPKSPGAPTTTVGYITFIIKSR